MRCVRNNIVFVIANRNGSVDAYAAFSADNFNGHAVYTVAYSWNVFFTVIFPYKRTVVVTEPGKRYLNSLNRIFASRVNESIVAVQREDFGSVFACTYEARNRIFFSFKVDRYTVFVRKSYNGTLFRARIDYFDSAPTTLRD